MVPSKPSLAVQEQVKQLVKAGQSTRQIASRRNLSKSAAARWAKKFREASQTRQRGGRKKNLSIFEAKMLVRGINKRCYSEVH
jgi:transposase